MNTKHIEDAIVNNQLDEARFSFIMFQTIYNSADCTIYTKQDKIEGLKSILKTACRFGSPEAIEMLINCGADMDCQGYAECLLDNTPWVQPKYGIVGIRGPFKDAMRVNEETAYSLKKKSIAMRPITERRKSLKILLDHKIDFEAGKLLYLAIIGEDFETADLLLSYGVTFPDYITDGLFGKKGAKFREKHLYSILDDFENMPFNRFINIAEKLIEAAGGNVKLKLIDRVAWSDRFSEMYKPTMIDRVINCFTIRRSLAFIEIESEIEMLEAYEKLGWLESYKDCMSIMDYTVRNNYTELTNWLLDYINRTFSAKYIQKQKVKAI